MHTPKLSVSLMCADLLNLQNEINILNSLDVDYYHIDIMDSVFVPNLTFGPDIANQIKRVSAKPVDIHLLMEYPRVIVRSLNFGENDIVTVHSECKENIMESIAFIKQKGARFGLALNPDTSIEKVKKYLPYVDVITLMLIVPGFAGSSMINGIMEKVEVTRLYLDKMGYDNIEISVDGSVSSERAKYMRKFGASIFVGGTAGIFLKDKPLREAVSIFKQSINE